MQRVTGIEASATITRLEALRGRRFCRGCEAPVETARPLRWRSGCSNGSRDPGDARRRGDLAAVAGRDGLRSEPEGAGIPRGQRFRPKLPRDFLFFGCMWPPVSYTHLRAHETD